MFGAPGTSAGLGSNACIPDQAKRPPKQQTIPAQSKHSLPFGIYSSAVPFNGSLVPSSGPASVDKSFPQTLSISTASQLLTSAPQPGNFERLLPVPGSSSVSASQPIHSGPAQKQAEERFSNPFEDELPAGSIQATGKITSPNFAALTSSASNLTTHSGQPTPGFRGGARPSSMQTSAGSATQPQAHFWSPPMAIQPRIRQGNTSTSSVRRHAVNQLVASAKSPTAKVIALTGHSSLGEAMSCLFQAWATQSADGQMRIRPLAFAAIIALHGPPSILSHVESYRYFNLPLMHGLSMYTPFTGQDGEGDEDFAKILELSQHGPIKGVAEHFGSRSSPTRKLVDDFFGVTPLVSSVTRFSRTNLSARSPATYIRSTAMKTALQLYRARGPACFEAMKESVYTQVLAVKPWLANVEGGLTLDQWQRNYTVCPRCTVMRIERSAGDFYVEGAHNLCLGVIRTRPSKDFGCLGTHVRCCDHYQWKWCPGFDVTGNEKCREAPCRSNSCPKYFARSTIWKHQMKQADEKARGTKRPHDDDDDDF